MDKNKVVKMVRIKYWHQETNESGKWCLTGLMSTDTANKVIDSNIFEHTKIVEDSDFT